MCIIFDLNVKDNTHLRYVCKRGDVIIKDVIIKNAIDHFLPIKHPREKTNTFPCIPLFSRMFDW